MNFGGKGKKEYKSGSKHEENTDKAETEILFFFVDGFEIGISDS